MNSEVEVSSSKTALYLKIAAGLAFLAGVGIGLFALAGPLAVWLGMANFQLGFGFLRIVNSWADWIAGIGLLIAIAVFVIARQQGLTTGPRLSAMAFIGCLVAFLSWYVPETFRPPEGTPAIHDIATDPYAPLDYVAIAPLRADAANNMDYGVMPGIDSVQQHIDMQVAAYPDIVPQTFSESPDLVYERALAAVGAMGWELVSADAQSRRIEATDTTFWFRFKDDVVVEITPDSATGSVLNARSLSRVGRSDVGKNAARLREFFALL